MIHRCTCSSHNCHKCSLYHSIMLWCSWGCILKNSPQTLSCLTLLSRTLFSPALSHLIIFTWILCLAFKAFIQSTIGSTCSFFFFIKKLFLYFVLLHPPTSPNVVFLPCLGFSLMRCPNKSFLQDSYSCLHSSLGYSFVLFSPMSNLGNYSLCLSSQPCNILLCHPSNDVQHVLTLCGSVLLIVVHSQLLH